MSLPAASVSFVWRGVQKSEAVPMEGGEGEASSEALRNMSARQLLKSRVCVSLVCGAISALGDRCGLVS